MVETKMLIENSVEKQNVEKDNKNTMEINICGGLHVRRYTLIEAKNDFVEVYQGKKFVGKYKSPASYEDCYNCNSIYNNKGRQVGSHCIYSVCDIVESLDCNKNREEQKFANIVDLIKYNYKG